MKLDVIIASPLSKLAIVLSSVLKSCGALSITACLSILLSIPSIIFVFMFASISFGIMLGSCVIAIIPVLNFLPSLAIVENMFGGQFTPRTLGASSIIMLAVGISFICWKSMFLLWFNNSVAIMLPINSSICPGRLLVSIIAFFPSRKNFIMSFTVVVPAFVSKHPVQFNSASIPSICWSRL